MRERVKDSRIESRLSDFRLISVRSGFAALLSGFFPPRAHRPLSEWLLVRQVAGLAVGHVLRQAGHIGHIGHVVPDADPERLFDFHRQFGHGE